MSKSTRSSQRLAHTLSSSGREASMIWKHEWSVPGMRAPIAVIGGLICIVSTPELLGQVSEGERRYFVRGLGRDTCVAWTGTRPRNDRDRLLPYTSWVDGYISAWNAALARYRPDLSATVTNVEAAALAPMASEASLAR